jgi:hypothetical protein
LLTRTLNSWLKEVEEGLPPKRPLVLTPGGWVDLHFTLQSWLSQFTSMKLPIMDIPFNIYH